MYIAQNKKTYANISNDEGGSVAINPVTTYLTTVSLKKTATPLAAQTAPSASLQSNSIAPSSMVSSRPPPLPVSAAAALPLRTQQQGQGLVLTKDTKRFTQPKGVYVSAQTAGCTRSLDSNSDNKENHRLSNLNENAATNNSLTTASSSSVLDSDTTLLLKSIAVVKSTTNLLKTMKMSGSKGDDDEDEDACSTYSPVMSGNNINGPLPALMDTSTTPTVETSSPETAAGNNMFMFDNRKRKHNMSRRGTLSPGTARAMMLEAFAMDTRRQDSSNSSSSAFNSPLKLISSTSFDCRSSSSSPLKQLSNTSVGSMDIVVDDDEDGSATIHVSNDSLDNSSKLSRGTAEDSITIPQRLDSIIIEYNSSNSSSFSSSSDSSRKDDDTSSSRAESPLQKFQRSESPDPSIEQSQPTSGDDNDRDDDDDIDDDAAHEMDLEETAIDGGASVGIEGLRMVMVTEGEEEIASMEAYGKELDSLLCDVSSSDVEQQEAMGVDPSLSTNMSIDTYSPTTPSVSSIINDDSLYISMDDCRDDDMSIIIPTADPIDYDVSNRSSSILTHASNNNSIIIIRPLPTIKLQYASPIPEKKRSSPLPSRYFLVETMDGAGVSDPESVFHIKCPSPMNQSLTASSVSSSSSSSLSSPSLKPPSPPNAPPSMKPSPLQKRAYNVSPIVCALSPLFNQSLSSIVAADESTDGGDRDDDVIMQDTADGSSDDDVERIHHLDTTEVIHESSDAYRAVAPFTPTSIVVKDDSLRDSDSDSREINKSSSSNSSSSSSKPSTIIHDSCMDDASPYSLVQYYRKQLCPSSDDQLLLGSDCSSFEQLESMLEQEYLQCQGRDMGDDDSDGNSCEGHSVEQHTTTSPPPVSCDSIHTDRASFSVDSELFLSSQSSSTATARSDIYCCPSSIITIDYHDVQSAQQTTLGPHVDDDGVDDAYDSLAPLDLVQIEVQAERRLKLRMEAAQWQYKWEMVMARLINTVIEKQRLKIADL